MLLVNLPRTEDILKVLGSYAGRDKALRSVCFGLILISTKTKNLEFAQHLQALAKQISQARTVCRQLNHFPLMVASRKLYDVFRMSNDKVDSGINLFVMVAYVFYQFFELAAWLGEAKIVGLNVSFWYKWAIYSWLAALVAGMSQILRRIFVIEPMEDELDNSVVKDKQRETNRRLDRITLVGLAADFVAGFNMLPHKVWWAGKLSPRTSSTFFFIASIIGLYKLF